MNTTIIQVEGMSCLHCVNSIEGALFNLPGVDTARVQ
jgi:copper chaperone CopZ